MAEKQQSTAASDLPSCGHRERWGRTAAITLWELSPGAHCLTSPLLPVVTYD